MSVLDSPRQTPQPTPAAEAAGAPRGGVPARTVVDASTDAAPRSSPPVMETRAAACGTDAPRGRSADVSVTADFATPRPPDPGRPAAVDVSVSSSGGGNQTPSDAAYSSEFEGEGAESGLFMGRLDLNLAPLPAALPRQITPGEASPRMPTPTELTVIDRLLERSVLSAPQSSGDAASARRSLQLETRPRAALPARRPPISPAAVPSEGDTPLRQRPREKTPATAAARPGTPSTGPAHAMVTTRAKARPLPGDDKPLMAAAAGIMSTPAAKIPRHHGCSCATLGPRDTESGRALPKHRRARSALAAFARLDKVAAAKEDIAMLAANTSAATTTESTRGRRAGTPRRVPVPAPRPIHSLVAAPGIRR